MKKNDEQFSVSHTQLFDSCLLSWWRSIKPIYRLTPLFHSASFLYKIEPKATAVEQPEKKCEEEGNNDDKARAQQQEHIIFVKCE